ncbi:MAG: serine/threonine-protein kinase, partial [Elusimicrobiales bacterium]|nr:serine/threonine-protein kinase [Elusimicrobiales bacterium]
VFVPGMLGQYRLTKKLGEGGMGAVYEGMDDGLQRKVAVKVILREKVDEDPSFLENFRREAQAAAKLNHPNIVAVYAFGEYEAQPFLAMELVQPDALDRMMKAQGMVLPATVLNIGYQIAQGLKAASEQGLIHGDVKPENVLINEAKEAKLADFGIAALMGKSTNNEVWGTPYYIAPETLLKQKVDLRADIYSLGGTLYHAIAGVPPFEGPDAVAVMKARLEGPARDLREVAPGCPEEIAKIVMRMLEAEPMRRYPNYDSLLADMRKAISASKASGGLGGKRIVIKGKTASAEMPSKPIPSVPINVPLTPPKAGLSKGMVAGIIGGIAFLFLAIIGGSILALMHVNSDDGKKEETSAEVPAAEAAVPVAEPSHELMDMTEEANAAAQALAKDVEQAGVLITQMRTKAQPMLFPEEEQWLTLQEPQPAAEGEEASAEETEAPPREILRKFQEALKLQAQLTEAATLRAELAKGLAALGEETPETLAKGKELVKTTSKNAAVKQFSRNMATLKRMRAHWDDIVDNARKEKNQRV